MACTHRPWHAYTGHGTHTQVMAHIHRPWRTYTGHGTHTQAMAHIHMPWRIYTGHGAHTHAMAHIHMPSMSKQSSTSKAPFPFYKVWYNTPKQFDVQVTAHRDKFI